MLSPIACVRNLVAAGIILAGVGVHHASAMTKVKAGHLVALDMAPLFLAKEGGCFAKYDLDVETVFFANPGDNNAALAGGEIDFSTNPFTLPFFAANAGVPIRTIAAAGGWGIMQVIADGKLKINSVEDLKKHVMSGGKKLKFASLQGDTLELILTRIFRTNGIPDSAVEIVNFDDLLAMVDAFRSGQVDVLSHIKPYTTDFVVNKGATLITDNAKIWSPHTPNTVVSVLEKTLQTRPQIVEAYLKGLLCAADMINKDPEAAVKILSAKNAYYRVSPEVLLNAFKNAAEPVSFVPDLDAIQSVVDDLSALGYIKGNKTKAVDIFRLDIIKKLEAGK